MNVIRNNNPCLALGVLWMACALPVSADTIYDNTAMDLNTRFNPAPFNGYASPGTMFYDSGPFSINPTPRSTLVFSVAGGDFPFGGLAMPVTSNMTWSVQFFGLGATDQAGVDLFSPPDVGGEHPDYWQNDAGVWSLRTNVVAMDFAARMDATVPEPSALSWVAIGAPVLLAAARSLRRKR